MPPRIPLWETSEATPQPSLPLMAFDPTYGLTPPPKPFASDNSVLAQLTQQFPTSQMPNSFRDPGAERAPERPGDRADNFRGTLAGYGEQYLGMSPQQANTVFGASKDAGPVSIADLVPFAGTGLAATDVKDRLGEGDYLGAGGAALGALPLVGAVGRALGKSVVKPALAGMAAALTTSTDAQAAGLPKLSPASVSKASESAFVEALKRGEPKPGEHNVGMGAREAAEPLSGGRIAQRRPTATSRTEDPDLQNLLVNAFTLKQDPRAVAGVANIISGMPATTPAMREMAPTERIDAFQDFIKRNLTDTWDKMTPDQQRYYAQWYFGANRMAEENARRYGIPLTSSAGNYAALSPQMDWNLNAHLGDRTLDILDRNPKATADMLRLAPTLSITKENPKGVYGIKGRPEILAGFGDRPLLNMNPEEQALFMRLYDEAHGPREYRYVLPSGDRGDIVRNKDGTPAKPGWANFPNIEKAIQSALSSGDLKKISEYMGEAHKVRNFYNDIVNPTLANRFGDATIDTHQIAGGLYYPLGGTHTYAGQGMGSAGPGSSVSGIHGLYPIYADATRQAALERNVPVLAMQSGPWEGIRSIMPAKWRTDANREAVDQIWRLVGEGIIPEQNARDMIYNVTGGIKFGAPPGTAPRSLIGHNGGPAL